MNICPVPDHSSARYFAGDFLAGRGADLQDICPPATLCHGADPLTLDYLGHMLTDWELTDLGNTAANALGVLAIMLGTIVAPLLWASRGAIWVLKGIFSGLGVVIIKIARLAVSPLILPCRLAAWAWDLLLSLLYRLEVS